jgi:membrane protease subunit HflC
MADLAMVLNEVALTELGLELVDVRVKQIDLPPDVSESVYRRMNAEREKEAREHRSQGQELAEGIQAAADREVTVIKANAYRDAEQVRGQGDAEATRVYADAFNQDPEFYSFTRSLRAYQDAFQGGGDVLLLQPDSEFFRYLKDSKGGR